MDSLSGTFPCVVTGATSGIGEATVRLLAGVGRSVVAVGRQEAALAELERDFPTRVRAVQLDMTFDSALDAFAAELCGEGGLSGLVHCAGVYVSGDIATTSPCDLDAMYQTNVRSWLRLTQGLLPALERGSGYIVFVNSSAGISAGRGAGFYAATQHALRALANGLRDEVNDRGIRVLSIHPGRTATPRMEALFRHEDRDYRPELLLQPRDVAEVILYTLDLPRHAELTEVHLRPAARSY